MRSSNLKIDFCEEQAIINSAAREFCLDNSNTTTSRQLINCKLGFNQDIWEQITELGWTGINIPEQYGGIDLGIKCAVPIVEQMGKTMMSLPYISLLLATEVIVRLGNRQQQEKWLPLFCQGKIGTVAFLDNEDWGSTDASLELTEKAGAYVLDGEKLLVSDAEAADLLIVLARLKGKNVFVLVEASQINKSNFNSRTLIDETKRSSDVNFQNVIVDKENLINVSPDNVRNIKLLGALLTAAESVGTTSITLDTIVSYLTTRKQFGKLIGSYQALKHPTVDILLKLDSAKSLVYHAASLIEKGSLSHDSQIACHMAKAQASEALSFAGDRAVQFHGGMGFTYDCDAMLFIRRAQWAYQQFGDPQHHRKSVARLVFK